MVSDQELEREFEEFSIKIENVAILDKLKDICKIYRLDANDVVDEWIAFTTENGLESEPTHENLDKFQRKCTKEQRTKPVQHNKQSASTRMYDKHSIDKLISEDDEDEDDVMLSYQSPSNKKAATKRQHTTPDMANYKRHTTLSRTPASSISPASTNATPSVKYGSRTNSGEVVCSFNLNETVTQDWPKGNGTLLSIQPVDRLQAVKKGLKYMFQKQADKSAVLSDIIDEMAEKLQKHHHIEEFSQLTIPAQEEVNVVGRICCDANGKLNAKSVVLEGSLDILQGQTVRMDLSKLSQFALFPGQVIAASGLNTRGDQLSINKIYEGVQLPFYAAPSKDDEIEMELEDSNGMFSVMAASGPFTTSDSIMYEPLDDLMKAVQKDKPDLLILLGPFIDAKQEQIEKGDLLLTFEELFRQKVQKILDATEGLGTNIIFVPSLRDTHHDYVYPQPPYTGLGNYEDMKRVHFVSDPSTLLVNGVVIGLTSVDILLQLGSEETASPPGSSDRLGRLVKHILLQHSYYPLQPPSEDVNLDYEQFANSCFFPCSPDILILPSDLRYFAKDILGCLCINPGRLAKGQIGGTYLRLLVKQGQKLNKASSSILQNSTAQILRI